MDEAQFDALLVGSRPTPNAEATATAMLLARERMPGDADLWSRMGSRRGRRWVVAAIGSAVLVTGAGTLTAYQLSIPPFQSLEAGVQRAQQGIEISYVNSLGRTVTCEAFIEYRNLDREQRSQIENVARSAGWKGYGQRTLDSLAIPDATPEEQSVRVSDQLAADLRRAAHDAVPEMADDSEATGPAFNGSSMSCGDGGADGRP